jgi:glyoxylase-like metal-dependent hydrolase (beta-lactamase superfamily II)
LKKPVQLSEKIHLIDDYDLRMTERTGTYVLMEEQITLIETSASPSIPYILAGLKELEVNPEDVTYIIVTHIHLDHAGGAGLLLTHCPNAKVIVHPKGARHLADPSRLILGAKAVYGDKFDELFDPILKVPEERLIVKNNGDSLLLSEKLTLRFYDTPGHANHHFSIYHPEANGIFSGDTAGIYYPQIAREGIEFYLPSTSPNQFDPDKMLKSIELYKGLGIEKIFFGHYSMSENPAEAFKQVKFWLNVFLEEAKQAAATGSEAEEQTQLLTDRLYNRVRSFLTEQGLNEDHPINELLQLDVSVSSMGLVDYLRKNKGGHTL